MDRMSGQGWPCPPHAHTCLPMAMAKGRTLGTDKETAQVYTVGHVLRICRAVHMSAPSSGSRLEPKNKKICSSTRRQARGARSCPRRADADASFATRASP